MWCVIDEGVLQPGLVGVRDSKDPDGPKLTFAPDEWAAFTTGIKTGEFGLS